LVSGNLSVRHRVIFTKSGPVVGSYKTKEAKVFQERARSIALAAAWRAGWRTVPPWVRVDMVLWNSRLDRDNLKPLLDALQGVCYPYDSRILDGWVEKRRDGRGERVSICVTEIDPTEYGYKS
jgi:Holliday junction resolvase RusA-like endonuclease